MLTGSVASVWLVHGLYNKLLHGSERHLAIVQSVPGLAGRAGELALGAIGALETGIGLWVLAGVSAYACAAVQTALLLSMNVVELTFARDLLISPGGLLPVNLVFLALAWAAADVRRGGRLRARLRRHPLPIRARLQNCLTLTFALPVDVLRPLLPPGLEPETFGTSGFIAVALVDARRLRPAAFPAWLGQDFFLAGYRVFVRVRLPDGRTLRGLRILRSDTNRSPMVMAGNLLTHYNYSRCSAHTTAWADDVRVIVRTPDRRGDLDLVVHARRGELPPGSPFGSMREARRFAGPLPFTFDYEPETGGVIAIRATRAHWQPVPASVDLRLASFFDAPEFAGCTPVLAAAFRVTEVDYRWERGVWLRPAGAPEVAP